MTARPAGATVHLDVRDGLRFDPADVGPLDVDAADAPSLLASGAYVAAESAAPAEPAVTAAEPEEADHAS